MCMYVKLIHINGGLNIKVRDLTRKSTKSTRSLGGFLFSVERD